MTDHDKTVGLYESANMAVSEQETKDSSLSRTITNDASLSGRWSQEDKAILDAITLKSLFYSEDWVYIICDLIAAKISNQYLRVMKQIMVDGKMRVEPAEDHPVQKILDDPNPLQDYHSFMYCVVVDLILLGNSIVWRRKADQQLLPVPGETVAIDFDRAGNLTRYLSYDSGAFDGAGAGARRMVEFAPNEVIHTRRPNPSSLLWGLSPWIPGQKSLLFNRYSSEYLNSFYLKGATPGLVLSMEAEANEHNALRLLRSFEMAHTGRRNQRRTMILPKGVKASQMSHTIADQQLDIHVDKNRETICALLKVPKHEVGLQTGGSLGSEEYKTALKNFWAATLKPTMRLIAGAFSKAFKYELGDRFFLEFDLGDVDILQDDKKAKADLATAMKNTRTINEIREEVWEDEPIEGGDALPGASAPMFPQFSSAQFSSQPDQFAPPPDQAASPVDETKEAEVVVDENKGVERVARFFKTNGDWFDEREQKISKGVEESAPDIYSNSLDMFADQAEAALKLVKKYLQEEKGYEPGYAKSNGVDRRSIKSAKIKNRTELKKRLNNALKELSSQYVSKQVDALVGTVDLGYDAAIDIPFKLPSQAELAALKAKGKGKRRASLEARGLESFANIDAATTENIMKVIDAGVEQGLTVQQISENIANKYRDEIDDIDRRAQTIARTETLTAVSLGQAAAMADAAKVIPNLQKMWINAGDDRVRGNPSGKYKNSSHDHWSLQGEVVDHDKAFSNGLQFPRDPRGDAGDVINCRCSWIMLPADQMDEQVADLEANQTPYERGEE